MKLRLVIAATWVLMASVTVNAQHAARLTPFPDFVAGVRAARPAPAQDPNAFQEMQQHILTMYTGEQVTHSFVADEHPFDCVPIEQQPSVRLLDITHIATPPPHPAPVDDEQGPGVPIRVKSQFADNARDDLGNLLRCEDGTIPMRRITLEDISRFGTLRRYLQKSPGDSLPDAAEIHKYATTLDHIDNLGGIATVNLWSPTVDTEAGQIFSLSQEWYTGGTGDNLQAAEVGWQNYPALYNGSQKSVLFIYWTPDSYKTGCYNLTCTAFVQTSNQWTLGASFPNYSTAGGTQYEVQMGFQYYPGPTPTAGWWLSVGGTDVGYYPLSIYKSGQMATSADEIEFGGETDSSKSSWGPMGSGLFSNAGTDYAAYQRSIYYCTSKECAPPKKLRAKQACPASYTVTGPSTDSAWGEYFYFGGPGGTTCQ
jgi:hypothetical protein